MKVKKERQKAEENNSDGWHVVRARKNGHENRACNDEPLDLKSRETKKSQPSAPAMSRWHKDGDSLKRNGRRGKMLPASAV